MPLRQGGSVSPVGRKRGPQLGSRAATPAAPHPPAEQPSSTPAQRHQTGGSAGKRDSGSTLAGCLRVGEPGRICVGRSHSSAQQHGPDVWAEMGRSTQHLRRCLWRWRRVPALTAGWMGAWALTIPLHGRLINFSQGNLMVW